MDLSTNQLQNIVIAFHKLCVQTFLNPFISGRSNTAISKIQQAEFAIERAENKFGHFGFVELDIDLDHNSYTLTC